MTSTSSTARVSEGMRKILRVLGSREVPGGYIPIFKAEAAYQGGIHQGTPALYGFWFEGYDEVRVTVDFDGVTQRFVLTGEARSNEDHRPLHQLTAATAPGMTPGAIRGHNEYLRSLPPEKFWPHMVIMYYTPTDILPDGLKAAIMRKLGLRT